MINIDAQTEANHNKRMANQSRALDRSERLWDKVERDCMVGELCREGKTVYYFFPVDGKYKESSSYGEIVEYIIRNGWVR